MLLRALVFICCNSLCFSSFAFSQQGHQLICQLAYENLPLASKTKVDFLIKQIPKAHKKRINNYLNRSTHQLVTFADSCTWPDSIRSLKSFKRFASWHYVNVARTTETINKPPCKNNCVSSAIKFHADQITHNTQNKWQSLLFLSHWIADLHQPLHVSFQSDRGGNKTKIFFSPSLKRLSCKNMHNLWDRCLLYFVDRTQLKHQSKHFSFSASDKLTKNNIALWANESLQITRNKDTKYCKVNDLNKECRPAYSRAIKIDQQYINKQSEVIQNQIINAARRLNLFLSKI